MAVKLCLVSVSLPLLLLLLLLSPRNGVSAQSVIQYLPGFDGPLPFYLETGYVSVDDSELFYYFVKSENNPAEDPLLLWLSGGPGCSGLGSVFTNGPLQTIVGEYNGSLPTFEVNPGSWTKISNILFVDAPVMTGFSYSRTIKGSYSNDYLSARQTYNFLRKWLVNHKEFLSNPLFVGGDSYSGKVLPVVVDNIANGIEAGDKPLLNLKGYFLGNPVTNRYIEGNAQIPYSHGMGLLSDELFESAKINCGGEYVNVDSSNSLCQQDLQAATKDVQGISHDNILEAKCSPIVPKIKQVINDENSPEDISGNIKFSTKVDPDWPCKDKAVIRDRRSLEDLPPFVEECKRLYGYSLWDFWANDDKVQEALHVRKGKTKKWFRCNQCGINYSLVVENSVPYHARLSKRGYRSLIYSGDHDFIVPFLGTQAWIRSLNYSITEDWRPWIVDGQVAGYTRKYANDMTFATVKGAGHVTLEVKPQESLIMYKRWLLNEPL